MPQDPLSLNPSGILPFPLPREPLSPLWSTFITRIWQPRQREVVLLYAQGELPTLSPNRLAISFNGLTLDPFDFSNRRVAKHRATKFLESLKPLRRGRGEEGAVGRAWWPEGVEGVVEAIKEEKKREGSEQEEEMERLASEMRPCDPEVWVKVVTWLEGIHALGALRPRAGGSSSSSSKNTLLQGGQSSYAARGLAFMPSYEGAMARSWSNAASNERGSHRGLEATTTSTSLGKRKR